MGLKSIRNENFLGFFRRNCDFGTDSGTLDGYNHPSYLRSCVFSAFGENSIEKKRIFLSRRYDPRQHVNEGVNECMRKTCAFVLFRTSICFLCFVRSCHPTNIKEPLEAAAMLSSYTPNWKSLKTSFSPPTTGSRRHGGLISARPQSLTSDSAPLKISSHDLEIAYKRGARSRF